MEEAVELAATGDARDRGASAADDELERFAVGSGFRMPAEPKLAWRNTRLGACAWRLRAKNGAARPAAPRDFRNVRRDQSAFVIVLTK